MVSASALLSSDAFTSTTRYPAWRAATRASSYPRRARRTVKNLMLGTAVLVERHVRRVDAAATAKSAGSASGAPREARKPPPSPGAPGGRKPPPSSAASASETNVPRGFRRRALEHHPVPRLEPVKHLAIHLFGGEELGEGFGGGVSTHSAAARPATSASRASLGASRSAKSRRNEAASSFARFSKRSDSASTSARRSDSMRSSMVPMGSGGRASVSSTRWMRLMR